MHSAQAYKPTRCRVVIQTIIGGLTSLYNILQLQISCSVRVAAKHYENWLRLYTHSYCNNVFLQFFWPTLYMIDGSLKSGMLVLQKLQEDEVILLTTHSLNTKMCMQ